MNLDYMKWALECAKKSKNDIPVGAVIVKNNKILTFAHNEKERKQDATKHAEMIVIQEASKILGNWRLKDCEMYVTLEPCPMCAWAIIQSRIPKVYFGSYDTFYGALGTKIDLRDLLNSNLEVKGGIMENECNNIIKTYFEDIR